MAARNVSESRDVRTEYIDAWNMISRKKTEKKGYATLEFESTWDDNESQYGDEKIGTKYCDQVSKESSFSFLVLRSEEDWLELLLWTME